MLVLGLCLFYVFESVFTVYLVFASVLFPQESVLLIATDCKFVILPSDFLLYHFIYNCVIYFLFQLNNITTHYYIIKHITSAFMLWRWSCSVYLQCI